MDQPIFLLHFFSNWTTLFSTFFQIGPHYFYIFFFQIRPPYFLHFSPIRPPYFLHFSQIGPPYSCFIFFRYYPNFLTFFEYWDYPIFFKYIFYSKSDLFRPFSECVFCNLPLHKNDIFWVQRIDIYIVFRHCYYILFLFQW